MRKILISITILSPWCLYGMQTKKLFNAIHQGDIAQVQALIKEGADVSMKGETGYTPLEWVIEEGGKEAYLAPREEPDPRFPWPPDSAKYKLPMVKILIQAGASAKVRNGKGNNEPLLMRAVTSYSRTDEPEGLEIIKELVRAGADINVADNRGITPLQWAIGHKLLPIVKYLLSLPITQVSTNDLILARNFYEMYLNLEKQEKYISRERERYTEARNGYQQIGKMLIDRLKLYEPAGRIATKGLRGEPELHEELLKLISSLQFRD